MAGLAPVGATVTQTFSLTAGLCAITALAYSHGALRSAQCDHCLQLTRTTKMSTATATAAPAAPAASVYLCLLTWAFTLFSTARVLAYLPTIWAVAHTGDTSAHSLLTWFTWLGANCTMALWLLEQGGRRWSAPVLVNVCNALMCAATTALIAISRLA
jgi:hypothetical protein